MRRLICVKKVYDYSHKLIFDIGDEGYIDYSDSTNFVYHNEFKAVHGGYKGQGWLFINVSVHEHFSDRRLKLKRILDK